MSREVNAALAFLRGLVNSGEIPIEVSIEAGTIATKLEGWAKDHGVRVKPIRKFVMKVKP